ncbi:MAG: zinc-binding dehydrogenase [Ilumatobacteraceae bacterium]|nr:zinc-binding dehydrogenase [Ilumatobacteraceae bacterium]
MKALRISRSIPRLGLARIASPLSPAAAAKIGPLNYTVVDAPDLPGPGWQRVRTRLAGICGSDLSLVEGHASLYFQDWVSFPFVPGHEVVGELEDGTRVVLEPVLGHEARGFSPPFDGAAPGDGDDYTHLATGPLEPGIQTGFCCSTGGGWAPEFVAHESQLHRISDDMPDERAVLIEPFAGGIHAALLAAPTLAARQDPTTPPIVAVLGAGTMGLAAVAGLRRYLPDVRIIVGARYQHQQALAKAFGADVVVGPDKLARAVRRAAGCHIIGDYLTSGAHVTIDAVGTSATVADAIRITRPRGRVVLLGMPADVNLDLTGLWHRETELKGAYTYGTETLPDGRTCSTFALAIETVNALTAERLLSATYDLTDHVDAIAHAAGAGRRGAVKIAFDMRSGDT